MLQASADWCVCTIPLSILSQIEINVGAPMQAAIGAVPYAVVGQGRPAVQAPLLGRGRADLRRHQLYRSADHPDLLSQHRLSTRPARACCSAATPGTGRTPTSSPPCRRQSGSSAPSNTARRSIRNTRPSSRTASPLPGTARRSRWAAPATGPRRPASEHYDNLCQIDGRIVLAGEHASYIPAWQEGAILSSLDAIARLHDRVVRS